MAPRKGHPKWGGKSSPRSILDTGLPKSIVDELRSTTVLGVSTEDLSEKEQRKIKRKIQDELVKEGIATRVERSDIGKKHKMTKARSDKGIRKGRYAQGKAPVLTRWGKTEEGVLKNQMSVTAATAHLPSLATRERERLLTTDNPITFLIKVMNGEPGFEAEMKHRIYAAKALADKCMPDLRTLDEYSTQLTGSARDYTNMPDSMLESLIANRITTNGRTRRVISRVVKTETRQEEFDPVHSINDAKFPPREIPSIAVEEVGGGGGGEDQETNDLLAAEARKIDDGNGTLSGLVSREIP